MNETCYSKWQFFQSFDLCASIIFFFPGKQDYKKTKSVLKATRLKAEAKKNSSGFRVRLARTYFLCRTTEVCICMSSIISACLSVLAHLWFCLSVCLPAKPFFFHLSVCLPACLPACLRACLTRSLFISHTLSSLTTYCRAFGSVTWNDVMWPPACLLKIRTSVENRRWEKEGMGESSIE